MEAVAEAEVKAAVLAAAAEVAAERAALRAAAARVEGATSAAAAGPRVTPSMVWPNSGGRDPFEDDEEDYDEDEYDEDEDGTYDDYAGYAMAPTATMPYNRIGPKAPRVVVSMPRGPEGRGVAPDV